MNGVPYEEWHDTLTTVHMWTQVVGKVQLALAPPTNHWWHIAQHVTARRLTTGPLPHGDRTFEVDLDFVAGFPAARVPFGGTYHPDLHEFVLPWPVDDGAQPDAEGVLAFLRSAYSAAADLGGWNRSELDPG